MSPTTRLGISTTPTKEHLKKGFFTKGQWHCNCQPRLPAVQLQVRRDSINKGRWFYTCQRDRTKGKPGNPDKCDFFLWADDARLREEGVLRSNSRAELTPTQKRMRQTTLSASVTPRANVEKRSGPTPVIPLAQLERQLAGAGSRAASSNAASSSTMRASDSGRTQSTMREIDVETDSDETTDDESEDELAQGQTIQRGPQASDKRKREAEDEEDYGDWSSGEEQQVAAITDSSSQGPGAQGRKRDAFATPAAPRTHGVAAGIPTPSFTDKPLRRVLFTEPEVQTSNKRQRTTESADSPSPSSSPAPAQKPSDATPGSNASVAEVVMGLLRDQKIDGAVRAQVQQELERFDVRARGLERGRDAARQATKKLEVQSAEQQQRIVALESERRLHAEARDNLRTGLMKLYSEN